MATGDSGANAAPPTSNITVRRGEPLVVITDLEKHYGDFHALKDIDLTPLVQEAEELEKRIRSQTEIGEAKPPEDDNHLYG